MSDYLIAFRASIANQFLCGPLSLKISCFALLALSSTSHLCRFYIFFFSLFLTLICFHGVDRPHRPYSSHPASFETTEDDSQDPDFDPAHRTSLRRPHNSSSINGQNAISTSIAKKPKALFDPSSPSSSGNVTAAVRRAGAAASVPLLAPSASATTSSVTLSQEELAGIEARLKMVSMGLRESFGTNIVVGSGGDEEVTRDSGDGGSTMAGGAARSSAQSYSSAVLSTAASSSF